MEQIKWSTPGKDVSFDSVHMKSPVLPRTPVNKDSAKSKQNSYYQNNSCFTVLPNYITPPSGITKFIAQNPFETELTNRLHLSVISPTVFTQNNSPSQDSQKFVWSVEELARIQPAKIEEFPVQEMHCTDPEVEQQAQEAITKFFSQNQIIPSPWDSKPKDQILPVDLHTPIRTQDELNSTKDTFKSKKDCWTQTILTFPSILPAHVEEALKPYFTFTQEQNVDSDEANSSNNSLRRKLFFTQDESSEDDTDTSFSSIKDDSLMITSSPPQSGMLINCTPLRGYSGTLQRNHGTPMANSGDLSPINVSPISAACTEEMSCQSIRSRRKSVARLDFTTDMSIEISHLEEKENTQENCISTEATKLGEQCKRYAYCFHSTKTVKENENIEMGVIPEESIFNPETEIVFSKRENLEDETCKIYSSTFQQNNTLSGIYGQQSVFNSAQDTGYQTYSMNSTNTKMENSSIAAIKHQLHWDDEVRLAEWKQNTTNIVSSTPSKNKLIKEYCI